MTGPEVHEAARIPARRAALYALLLWAAAMAALECAARLVVPADQADVMREHAEMIDVLGLPDLNQTMVFDPVRFWRLRDGLREHRVRGAIRDQPVDFRVSTHAGFRGLRAPGRQPLRVLVLGDSCAFGLGVDDADTWPAQLEGLLQEDGIDAEVTNGGVPGYTAYQGLKTWELEGRGLEPDVVVVSFGFNDRDRWASQSDLEVAKQLRIEKLGSPLRRSRLVVGLDRLIRGLRPAPEPASPEGSARRARLSPDEFSGVLEEIVRQVEESGATPVLLLWPYRFQSRQGIELPVHYQAILAGLGLRLGVPTVNPLTDFAAAGDAAFVDHVHASPLGNRVAADAVARVVGRLLIEEQATE